MTPDGGGRRFLEVAYYYPAPFWTANEGSWIKSLLLFFDRIAILLPDYMYGRHIAADPSLAGPLEDLGLLEILDPSDWVDQEMTETLSRTTLDMVEAGIFDDLPADVRFQELSQSRMGYGADLDLASSLVEELQGRGLAEDSADGVSIPLHPVVRTTILVLLAQLARSAGERRNMRVHPTTSHLPAGSDLRRILSLSGMPSAGHVVSLDLEFVSLDLEQVPLDELLAFRAAHAAEYQAYARSLRGFMEELSQIADPEERIALLSVRSSELADSAHALRTRARRSFSKAAGGWALGLTGAAWSFASSDPLGIALSFSGLVAGAIPMPRQSPSAYSYVFAVRQGL